jgi:uncharacterized protein YkwD
LFASFIVTAQPASALTSAQLASRVVAKVNALRSAKAVPKLAGSAALNTTAARHTALMASRNRLTTQVPGELSAATRIFRAGFDGNYAGEVVGAVTTQIGVLNLIPSMMRNRALSSQILSRYDRYVGVSVRWDALHRKYWVAVDFARPRPAPLTVTIANAVLSQLNAERRAHGLPALVMHSRLVASAHAHNLAMAAANTMSHQLPGELNFASRILRAGYDYRTAGENVGWNSLMTQAGALYLETLMYNEVPPNDGHRRNILSTSYRHIGIDIYFDAAHHKLWLTEDFGSLL